MIINKLKKNKKFNYMIISLVMLIYSCNKNLDSNLSTDINCIDVHVNMSDNKGRLNGDKLFTGACNAFYDSLIIETRSFKKGNMTGKYVGYYLNGNVQYIGFRKNGEIHGPYIGYYPNGVVKAKGKLKNGYYQGNWEFFDENGKLSEKKVYLKGSVITGDNKLITE